jgi:DNA-binding MarR family transcriptional regulator
MSLADPRTVDELLNYRLSRLLASSGAMTTLLCEGRYGITRREWRLIALLAVHGPMSPSELSERAHLQRARVSRLLTELTARRLVRRQTLREDARRAVVELTEAGQRLYDELFPQSVEFNGQVVAALAPAELRAFESALDKLTEAAERLAASRPVAEKADRRHGGARRIRER